MLGGEDRNLDVARALGVSLFAGEAEGRLDEVLQDAYAGALKPMYNYMADLPGIEGSPAPILSADRVKRTGGSVTSFDAGRAAPTSARSAPSSTCRAANRAGARPTTSRRS